MNKKLWIHAVVALLLGNSLSQAQRTSSEAQKPAAKSESFLDKVLRITGISANPTTLKGPGDEVKTGEIWLVDLVAKQTRQLTLTGGYRSPVFTADGDILALRGMDIVRLKSTGSEPRTLCRILGATKLVGFSESDPDRVLVLSEDDAGSTNVGLVSVSTGTLTSIPFDRHSDADRQMLEHLQGWTRVYGNETVYVNQQSRQAISGPISWVDVFLRAGEAAAVDVSQCAPINCGQPSLSPDRRLLVFVKSDQD